MKHFRKIIFGVFIFWLLLASISSYIMYKESKEKHEKGYNIDINRIVYALSKNKSIDKINLANYPYVKDIQIIYISSAEKEISDFFAGVGVSRNMDYRVRPLFQDGELLGFTRFIYNIGNPAIYKLLLLYNIFLFIMTLSILIILSYIREKILKPFHEIVDLPYELSKGHLKTEIKENKSYFFGKFLWGLDMLRENLEAHKIKELKLEKEKKTLILSISHDIKTPVSTIKLYAKALYDNLYDTEEKRIEVAKGIEEKANQIEGFVRAIITTSKNDILDITVDSGEFYLSDLVNKLLKTYEEKLKLLNINFQVDEYDDILLKGDLDRLIEVMENIFENAIKYGDGRRISITFGDEDYCKLITITNSGLDIPETEFVHMFESFWRGSNSFEKPGNGLGLYICKEIMKKMDGDIYVQSTSNSMGITLVVRYSLN